MKYTIFDVGEGRELFVHDTTYKLRDWNRIYTKTVDGRIPLQLKYAMEASPYSVNADLKVGQLGIWFTVINALDEAPLVTFENDAIIDVMLPTYFNFIKRDTPEDADFVALFYPLNQVDRYRPEDNIGNWLTKAHQTFGGVSMYYTEKGAQRIKDLLQRDGIIGQYDDQLFAYAAKGELNAYTSRPDNCFVGIREADSIVQDTEYLSGINSA